MKYDNDHLLRVQYVPGSFIQPQEMDPLPQLLSILWQSLDTTNPGLQSPDATLFYMNLLMFSNKKSLLKRSVTQWKLTAEMEISTCN